MAHFSLTSISPHNSWTELCVVCNWLFCSTVASAKVSAASYQFADDGVLYIVECYYALIVVRQKLGSISQYSLDTFLTILFQNTHLCREKCSRFFFPFNHGYTYTLVIQPCPHYYVSLLRCKQAEFQSFCADVVCQWCSQRQDRPPVYKLSIFDRAGALICSEGRQVAMRSTCHSQTDPADLPRCTSEGVRDSFCHISCFSFCVF